MIDLAIANCKDHHICFCQKMRLEKAEYTAEVVYKAWIEKRDQVGKLQAEVERLGKIEQAAQEVDCAVKDVQSTVPFAIMKTATEEYRHIVAKQRLEQAHAALRAALAEQPAKP